MKPKYFPIQLLLALLVIASTVVYCVELFRGHVGPALCWLLGAFLLYLFWGMVVLIKKAKDL